MRGGGSLVVKDPGNGSHGYLPKYKDLIDWPDNHDSLLDPSDPDEPCCRDGYVMNTANAPISSHVFKAHKYLAWMSNALGRPAAEGASYEATAALLRRGILSLARPAEQCDPPVGPCFADGANVSHTSVQSTMYVLGSGVLTPAEAVPYLPFLTAKSTPFPRCSAALSPFLFESLYTIAQAQPDSNEAADLAFDLMARDGHRSWREMIAQNATMTIEHWYGVIIKKHTWSHPWAAGPAAIIVKRLFGVRPLDIGYKTVAIHPQPPRELANANTAVPTARGLIGVVFQQSESDGLVLTNVTIPAGVKAEVCLPTALLPHGAASALVVNGAKVACTRPQPGQVCVAEKLGGGSYTVKAWTYMLQQELKTLDEEAAIQRGSVQASDDDALGVVVKFADLRTVGNSSSSSYWFPAPIMGIPGVEPSDDVVIQQVQRAGDGKQGCCHGKCCDPHNCCAATVSTGTLANSSWVTVASAGNFPALPGGTKMGWASDAANFSSLNGFACRNGTCTGQLVQWKMINDEASPIITPTLYQDLQVNRVPSVLMSASWSGAAPIMLTDGTLMLPLYGRASDAPNTCKQHDGENSPWCLTAFYFTASQDQPLVWTYRSRIDHINDMGPGLEGPSEQSICQLKDGRLLTVFRVDSFHDHWAAVSEDGGASWGASFSTGTWSVAPHVAVLESGAIVLTGGRPGIGLWVTVTSNLKKWKFFNMAAQHNALATGSTSRYPTVDTQVCNASSPDSSAGKDLNQASSTGYMGLLPIGNDVSDSVEDPNDVSDSVLLTYDFLASGWNPPPGKLGAADFVFSMRATVVLP